MEEETMKVKPILLACLVSIVIGGLARSTVVGAVVVRSAPTNDLLVQLSVHSARAVADTKDSITISFFTVTNRSTDLILLKPEFFASPELFDAQGRKVPLTRPGKLWGSQFEKLSGFSEKAVKMFRGSYRMAVAYPDAAAAINLFSVEDIFDLRKPGDYTLVLHAQVFRRQMRNGKYQTDLVRFPPVRLDLRKP